MPKNKAINLLPQEEFETSIIGRILRWAMGTFRIIVIITEMVVMGAFLSRFWLDAQNSDLNESLKVKTAQVAAQAEFEKQFRGLQAKLAIFKTLSQNPKASDRIEKISSKIPEDISLSGITISDTSAQIKGSAISEGGIAQFVANLKTEPSFKKVNLGQVNSSDNDQAVTLFTLTITF
ncbi:MAG TPA: PilN domain-containing protein [Alphaproteobacteria bacterium]|jgi:Tfp pilus assembly protein PilN|nr:PilN domain-containing protein [Alphaproteobacteria bacterium]